MHGRYFPESHYLGKLHFLFEGYLWQTFQVYYFSYSININSILLSLIMTMRRVMAMIMIIRYKNTDNDSNNDKAAGCTLSLWRCKSIWGIELYYDASSFHVIGLWHKGVLYSWPVLSQTYRGKYHQITLWLQKDMINLDPTKTDNAFL